MAYRSIYTGSQIDALLGRVGLNSTEIATIKATLENAVPGGESGVGITSVKQTTTSTEDGGTNVVTITLSDGQTFDFYVKNGNRGSKGDDGFSPVVSVNKIGKVTTITITDANGTKTATINDGKDGASAEGGGGGGEDGIGIASIVQTTKSTEDDGINIITVTLTDGSAHTFEVQNGSKGSKGDGGTDGTSVTVESVSESSADGGSNIVTFSDGKTLTVKNGSKGSNGNTGATGATGVGISSVKQTATSNADGGSNVVTVTLTNGTTSTFTVKNGSKGSKGDTGPAYTLTSTDKNTIAAAVKDLFTTETWTFTLANGSTVTKKVVLE